MDTCPQLATSRLVMDWLEPGDAPLMLSIWNDPAFIRNVGDRGIRDLEQAQAALEDGIFQLYAEHGYGPYRLRRSEDSRDVGICGLFKRENLAEPDIGFALLPGYYRKGYALEAAQAVLKLARHSLKLPAVSAIVNPSNQPSIRLLERLGLSYAGDYQLPGDPQQLARYMIRLP